MRTLKDLQEQYNKSGVKSLRDAELLHLMGLNLDSCDLRQLFTSNKEELQRKGFTPATALKLTILGEIAHRYALMPVPERVQISSSASAAKLIAPILKDLPHEECWVLYLNRSNKLLRQEKLSKGGLTATVVDVKLIVKRALELLASSIILVHNHPSGNAQPGESDKAQTRILKDAATLFDITLLDHLIIAGDKYYSFADEGII